MPSLSGGSSSLFGIWSGKTRPDDGVVSEDGVVSGGGVECLLVVSSTFSSFVGVVVGD